MKKRGAFISFEGGDGAGKSTQIERLAQTLQTRGRRVLVTREPGGSPGGEAIRELLVTGDKDRWSAHCEALLMYAARCDHLDRTIRPALARGETVITDRFADSTMAYQGIAGSVGEEFVNMLYTNIVGEDGPDLTIILDIPAAGGLTRAGRPENRETRFETKGDVYQERVREAFLKIARDNPQRCAVINAGGTIEDVSNAIADTVKRRLPELFV